MLNEFFMTGRYRPRAAAETHATSSPSMDISKASNFERYLFDIVGRDPAELLALWQALGRDGCFDLAATAFWPHVAASGFVSGSSTHADRIATIRGVHARYGVLIDPHTADGFKVAQTFREPQVPMICLETALPAKFASTIREALDIDPPRPHAYADLESRPQHCTALPAEAKRVAAFIDAHAGAPATA